MATKKSKQPRNVFQKYQNAVLAIVVAFSVGGIGTYYLGQNYALTNYGCNAKSLPTLREGSTGACVKYLQSVLNQNRVSHGFKSDPYYPLATDGLFYNKTYQDVRAFQKYVHTTVDGVVGPTTWWYLLNA